MRAIAATLLVLLSWAARAGSPVTVLTAPALPPQCEGLLDAGTRPSVENARLLLRCFEPNANNTTSLDVTEQHVAAGERFFVAFPRALKPEAFGFVAEPVERRRALALLAQLVRWTEFDEARDEARPTGAEAPFAALALSCEELDGLRPASRTALELIIKLRGSSRCSGTLSANIKRAGLGGSSQAMAFVCSTVTADELAADTMRSAMLRAVHFDRGTIVCTDRTDGSISCGKREQRTPGADTCLSRLQGFHTVFVHDALMSDGLTLSFLYLGSPKVVFTVTTDEDGKPVQGPVSTTHRGTPVPPVVAAALLPGRKPTRISITELPRSGGPVRAFTIKKAESTAHVAVVVVDVDGSVSMSLPR